jgi:hypothetical protein
MFAVSLRNNEKKEILRPVHAGESMKTAIPTSLMIAVRVRATDASPAPKDAYLALRCPDLLFQCAG